MKQFIKDYFLALVFFVGAIIALVSNINYESKLNTMYNTLLYPKTESTASASSVKTAAGNKTTLQGNYRAVLEPDKKMRCTFRSEQQNVTLSGNFLTDGKFIKSFVSARINNVYSENNGLILGNETYIWPSGSETGLRISNDKVPAFTDTNPVSELFIRAGIGPTYDLTCYDWESYDKNTFVIPINVTFQDISDSIGELVEKPCLVCTTMTDKTKQEACKKVYNCK